MRKIAIIFILAVLVPSLVLAWLAMRSLRDQEFVMQRQRSLLYQGVTDAMATEADSIIVEQQRAFGAQVEQLLAQNSAAKIARSFDELLRTNWPFAQVGFVVTMHGELLCPSPLQGAEARAFVTSNGKFLANRESAEIYWNSFKQIAANTDNNASQAGGSSLATQPMDSAVVQGEMNEPGSQPTSPAVGQIPASRQSDKDTASWGINSLSTKAPTQRKVSPQQKAESINYRNDNSYLRGQNSLSANSQKQLSYGSANNSPREAAQQQVIQPADAEPELSKAVPAEAEFRQIIGEASEGTLARFVDNKLNVLFWHRSPRDPNYVFGAQLALPRLISQLQDLTASLEPALQQEICIAVLDDTAKPVAQSRAQFQANWKHPFVATEIGDSLPHWEIAAYLINPAQLTEAARTAKLTLSLLIATLVIAITVGGWLVVHALKKELHLARQKTDFVSNVSHELKTPLTSIRMFSELLAEQRVSDPAKQRSYLNIITAETARLTRLINNVLDFSRMERGEKKYNFRDANLAGILRDTVESYRPHLENSGFKIDCLLPVSELPINGDTDAIAQVIVNLLSNAEKYSNGEKKITVEASRREGPLPCAEVKILDRGNGVPRGCEEKIFEKFYRAHDSLASGIQGSGLGLTLARQIARAHGGDVIYEPRQGGGSCFCLRLPLKQT